MIDPSTLRGATRPTSRTRPSLISPSFISPSFISPVFISPDVSPDPSPAGRPLIYVLGLTHGPSLICPHWPDGPSPSVPPIALLYVIASLYVFGLHVFGAVAVAHLPSRISSRPSTSTCSASTCSAARRASRRTPRPVDLHRRAARL